jgi:hypothetical protein
MMEGLAWISMTGKIPAQFALAFWMNVLLHLEWLLSPVYLMASSDVQFAQWNYLLCRKVSKILRASIGLALLFSMTLNSTTRGSAAADPATVDAKS